MSLALERCGALAGLRAKVQARLVRVVRAAAQLDVICPGITAHGVWLHVVELETAGLPAPPLDASERAPPAVALPHLPPDRRGDMA